MAGVCQFWRTIMAARGELLWQHVVRILIGFGQELNSEQDEVGRGVEEISRCRLPCGRKVYRKKKRSGVLALIPYKTLIGIVLMLL